jgi:LacI family transcriptional regulator/LacI family repressor for deo operon, udp, cdd, tsx, nupC, and nupG
MSPTIKDIAKRVGVSHSTVSRALSGSALIAPETTNRIRLAAAEMGYQASAAARSLKTKRSRVLGVIVSSLDDPFFAEILQGIEDAAQASGYSLFIASSQRDPERGQKVARSMMEHRADGVIICSTSFSTEQSQQLQDGGFRMVVINNQAAENFRYSIFHDDVDGARQITRHLIDLGHRRIAYLGDSLSGRTSLDRLTGFHTEMASAGLVVPSDHIFEVPGGTPEIGATSVNHFLDLPVRPTAIVCFNDMLAIGLLKALQQADLEIPADISITGFDNIRFSTYTNPPLTTFDQPKRFIGMEATRLLLDLLRMENTSGGSEIKILKGRLLIRKSTAAPNESV